MAWTDDGWWAEDIEKVEDTPKTFVDKYKKACMSKGGLLYGVETNNIQLEDLMFGVADMDTIVFTHVSFDNVTFADITLRHVKFIECSFTASGFYNCVLKDVLFEGCIPEHPSINSTNIKESITYMPKLKKDNKGNNAVTNNQNEDKDDINLMDEDEYEAWLEEWGMAYGCDYYGNAYSNSHRKKTAVEKPKTRYASKYTTKGI